MFDKPFLQPHESSWPRDEWVLGHAVGTDGRMRMYVIRLQVPRFTARVVAADQNPTGTADEPPADLASGPIYRHHDDFALCEVAWFDAVDDRQRMPLLAAAAEAVERLSV